MKTARQVAAEALMKMNKDSGYSNLVIDGALEKNELLPRDKAFCTALFYGVLERRLTIDAMLQKYCKEPLRKLAPQVRELLRIAVYQIVYMDGVPTSAAVNESIELVKKMKCAYAAGFMNGVLRGFLRDGGSVDCILPDRAAEPMEYLSLLHSVPRWLVEKWVAGYGMEQAQAVLAAAQNRPPMYLRVNTVKTSTAALAPALEKKELTVTPHPQLEGCLEVWGSGEIDHLVLYKRGQFTVQDIASQLCAHTVEAQPGMRVLDVCAAPGGKSFTIAQCMENRGELLALDLHDFKAKLIHDGAKRLGLSCIKTGVSDAAVYHPELGLFDRVLCDVPCSGLGIIRRKPEIRYKDPADLAGLPQVQYKILETSSKYVGEGGRLLYSTCTLSREENDEVANRFLAEHPEFAPAPLPAWLAELLPCAQGAHMVTLLPEMLNSDGFFMALFTRRCGACK